MKSADLKDWLALWMGLALGIAYLLPNHYSPWVAFHQEFAAALAFIPVCLWASVRARRWPATFWGGLALAAVPLAQHAAGMLSFGADAYLGFLYLAGFALCALAGAQLVADRKEGDPLAAMEPLCLALLVAGLVSVAIATHQWLMMQRLAVLVVDMPSWARPFANLAQPNHLATLLLMGMASALLLFESKAIGRATAAAAAVVLVFGLVMTGSRSVVLALIWLVPLVWHFSRRIALRARPLALAAFAGLHIALSWMWPEINRLLLISADAGSMLERVGSPDVRFAYWRSMLEAVAMSPWLGYGWNQSLHAQIATALDFPPMHFVFESAHNFMLDLMLWCGVPLAAACGIALLLWVWRTARAVSSGPALAALLMVLIVFSHSLVEYPLKYAYFLLPVGFVMGGLDAVRRRHAPPALQPSTGSLATYKWLRPLTILLAGAALVLVALVIAEYLPFEEEWRRMQYREARIGDLKPTPVPKALLLDNLETQAWAVGQSPNREMPAQDIARIHQVWQRYGISSIMYKGAKTELLQGHRRRAEAIVETLCRIHPRMRCALAREAMNGPDGGDGASVPSD